MSMERILLIDNSNTRTKFALAEAGQLLPERRTLPTADITPHTVQCVLEGWVYSRAIICSVAPQAAAVLRSCLGCPTQEISAACCPDLVRGYPAPDTLGADRLANAAAAAAHYPLPCVAVDLGTACTFDAVVMEDGRPRFLGGIIAPGLPSLSAALAGSTALLPATDTTPLRTEQPSPVGTCTQAALQAGLYYGFPGMVQGILQALHHALPQPPCIVLTGGDARLPSLSGVKIDFVDNSLTLKGILALSTPS